METITEKNIFTDIISREDFILLFSSSEDKENWFTEKELETIGRKGLSGSLAARYLIRKRIAYQVGINIAVTEIEILNDPSGKPEIRFSERWQTALSKAGFQSVVCSLSHSRNFITSLTIFLSNGA